MKRSRPDSPAHRAAEEAAEWLVLLEDDAGEDNRARFLEWLRSSTVNVEEFLRLSALERRLRRRQAWPHDSVADLVAAAAAGPDVALLPGAQRRQPHRRIYLAAAAMAVAVIGGSLLAFQSWRANEANTYATTIGEQRSVTLADGSIVELNSQSRLQTHYSDDERQVVLTHGEAIFRVAKNPQRPFRVRVGGTDIVAVGTAFNVNVRDMKTVVTVLEGRVRVSDHPAADRGTTVAAANPVELGQGEQAVIARDRATPVVVAVDPIKAIAWTERRLIFDNTPLDTVAAEFARYHTRTIRLTTSSLKDRRITGVFDANDPASLIEFLRTDQAINVEADEKGWKLSSSDLLIGTAAVEKK
jgi:transmembrane sensor